MTTKLDKVTHLQEGICFYRNRLHATRTHGHSVFGCFIVREMNSVEYISNLINAFNYIIAVYYSSVTLT